MMSEAFFPYLLSLIALLLCAVIASVVWLIRRSLADNDTSKQANELHNQLSIMETRYDLLKQENHSLKSELDKERQAHQEKVRVLERTDATLSSERKQAQEKIDLLNQAQESLKLEFHNLANRIMEEKSEKFTLQNKTNIESLMTPLREQLKDFKKKVEDTYDKESKERVSLQEQIINLQKLNNQLSEDAHNLTLALKGNSKTQGNWGELILERILEQSGLEKGREYETQSSFSQEDSGSQQKRYQPDVLIHLPEGKTIIVDSKVSLTAYESFCSEENDKAKQKALKEHVRSVKKHINELSEKTYHNIDSLNTLDFVVMFMPIEAAFLLAMQEDQGLYTYAMDRNIFIVSPSNLLVMLRTINHTWRNEKQNQNAWKIADKAGRLYDKFVGFVEDMDDIGKKINQTQKSWEAGMNKLQWGTGNLVKRTEELKKLGAKTNKALPENLLNEDTKEQ